MKLEYQNLNHGFLAGFSHVVQKTTMIQPTVESAVEILIRTIRQNPQITQSQLMDKLKLSRRGVEWYIKNMKEKGLLKRHGTQRGKGGHWEVLEKEEARQ